MRYVGFPGVNYRIAYGHFQLRYGNLNVVNIMDDIEGECEDALFELCDARERYPLRCANELQNSIKLKNDVNTFPTLRKPCVIDKSLFTEQNERLDLNFTNEKIRFDDLDSKLRNIATKLENLKAVADQIEREKKYLTNKLLEG